MAAHDRDIETAGDVCAFFARQVRRHEEDEERSLFPRLEANAALHAVLGRLSREHREHEVVHARLEEVVAGRFEGDVWAELAAIADLLTRAYRAHIEEEETHLFPAARELLSSDALEAISTEMAARRGR